MKIIKRIFGKKEVDLSKMTRKELKQYEEILKLEKEDLRKAMYEGSNRKMNNAMKGFSEKGNEYIRVIDERISRDIEIKKSISKKNREREKRNLDKLKKKLGL